MKHIRRSYITTDSGQFHVISNQHTPDKKNLVLLHQTASSSQMYLRLIPYLDERFNIIAPDTPGFGESDALTETSITNYAKAILTCIKAFEFKNLYIFGHHTGASIASEIAYLIPKEINSLILSGPPLLTAEQIETLSRTLLPFELIGDGTHITKTWERLSARLPDGPPMANS